jgi:hypothetical protein
MRPTFYRFVVGRARLANAIIGHILHRAALADAGRTGAVGAQRVRGLLDVWTSGAVGA